MLIYKLARLKDRNRLLLDDQLVCLRVCINEPILTMRILSVADEGSCRDEKFHPVPSRDI